MQKQFENLELMFTDGVGEYDFPAILPLYQLDTPKFIEFDYAIRAKQKNKLGIHFFEFDYKFNRLWRTPQKYIDLLKQFSCVVSPDFSEYIDFPKAIQIYNHYRNCWLARYWQENGITVIPNISWSTPENWEWQIKPYPKNSIVAISNIGCMKDKNAKQIFESGYKYMIEHLTPKKILLFSNSNAKKDLGENIELIKCEFQKGGIVCGK